MPLPQALLFPPDIHLCSVSAHARVCGCASGNLGGSLGLSLSHCQCVPLHSQPVCLLCWCPVVCVCVLCESPACIPIESGRILGPSESVPCASASSPGHPTVYRIQHVVNDPHRASLTSPLLSLDSCVVHPTRRPLVFDLTNSVCRNSQPAHPPLPARCTQPDIR